MPELRIQKAIKSPKRHRNIYQLSTQIFSLRKQRVMGSQTLSQLPIVDFSDEELKPGTEAWLTACHVVRTALEDHGCFLAHYNKIDEELCNSVISAMEEVFGLPVETKRQKTTEKLFHGYVGQVSWLPLYESLAIEDPVTIDSCQKFTHIMWPQGNDQFCKSIHEYAKALEELDRVTKRLVFESYGVEKKKYDSFIESNNYLLRSYKYRVPEMGENNLGIHSHSDISIFTLLHQLNKQNGLEVKLKDGDWCHVDTSGPSLFVVLAGDVLQCWSNGRIRACEHRVIMNAKKIRYSMGLSSSSGEIVEIPEELVDEEHPLRYKPLDYHGYLRFFDKERIQDTNTRLEAYCGI